MSCEFQRQPTSPCVLYRKGRSCCISDWSSHTLNACTLNTVSTTAIVPQAQRVPSCHLEDEFSGKG